MSEYRRPANRLAKTLELSKLTLFIEMRSLVLASSDDEAAALETALGHKRDEAIDYFIHFHDWKAHDVAFLRDERIERDTKIELLIAALERSRNQPLIIPAPES